MKKFMRIEHGKLQRLIAVFLVSLTGLITAKQVIAEIKALVPENETDPLLTLNNAFRAEYMAAHMPRDSEITMQYFERLLEEPVEGRRIIFAEGLWEEPRALDLLGTHMVDGSAGAAFFGEFMRMHRDLLSDAARVYIQNALLKSNPKK